PLRPPGRDPEVPLARLLLRRNDRPLHRRPRAPARADLPGGRRERQPLCRSLSGRGQSHAVPPPYPANRDGRRKGVAMKAGTSSAVEVEHNVPAVMRDGTILRADVYRPRGGGPYPAVVERTPYGKNVQAVRPVVGEAFASRGYILVVQDSRGRYHSDGEFVPFYIPEGRLDGQDGYDTVEWAARLPNCTGQVGVCGQSYDAVLAWDLAVTRPPSLAAMVVGGMSPDSRDVRPGIFRVAQQLCWNLCHLAPDTQRRSPLGVRGPTSPDDALRLQGFEVGKW